MFIYSLTNYLFLLFFYYVDYLHYLLTFAQIFRRIHAAYVNHASNPFYDIDSEQVIKSKKFEQEIEAIGRGRALEGGNRNSLPATAP